MADARGVASTLSRVKDAISISTSNLNKRFLDGGKTSDTVFFAQVLSGGKVVLTSKERMNIDRVGAFQSDGISTHVALTSSNAMIPVINPINGEITFTRNGSFQIDNEGNIINSSGHRLLTKKLDENGQIPNNAGMEIADLETVNTFAFNGKPNATSNVRISARLDSGTNAIKGNGQLLRFFQTSSSSFSDIIVPSTTSRGSLKDGDVLRIGTNISDADMIQFTYGGFTSSKHVSHGIFGVNSVSQMFQVGSAGEALRAFPGDSLSVIVNGNMTTLTFRSDSSVSPENYQFNSLQTLAQALSQVENVTASISNGRLYIASRDGVSAIEFIDSNSTKFIENLGIENIPAAASGVKRFSTMKSLFDQINQNSNLSAEIDPTGGIYIKPRITSAPIYFDSRASRINNITSGTVNPPTNTNQRTINIKAHASGLTAGDYVKIDGSYSFVDGIFENKDLIKPGVYYVTGATEDYFTIAVAGNVSSAVNTANTQIFNSSSLTWQKTFGHAGDNITVSGTAGVDITDDIKMNITLDPSQFSTLSANIGDTVYINGFGKFANGTHQVTVADGYYLVTDSDSGTNTITIIPSRTKSTSVLNTSPSSFNIRKISENPKNFDQINIPVVPQANYSFNSGTNQLTISLSASEFESLNPSTGELFNISNLANFETGTHSVTVANGNYRIISSDSTTRSFTIEVASALNAGVAADIGSFDIQRVISSNSSNIASHNGIAINGNELTITHANLGTIAFATGDYISIANNAGFVEFIKDNKKITLINGTYEIRNANANDITIIPTLIEDEVGADSNIPILNVVKIVGGANNEPLNLLPANQQVISFTQAGSNARVHMPNHGLQVGQYFRFRDAPDSSLNFAGFSFRNNDKFSDSTNYVVSHNYRVTRIDPQSKWFEFELEAPATATKSFVIGRDGLNAPELKIDKYGSLMSEASLSSTKFIYEPSYNPQGGDSGNNIAGGKIKDAWSQPFSVYDSLGSKHEFKVGFLKLNENQWAVEIYNVKSSDGTFSAIHKPGTERANDGQIASGIIEFDGNGNIKNISPELRNPINIRWKNLANDSEVSFDFGQNSSDEPNGASVTQVRARNDMRFIFQNGYAPGDINNISIDKEGNISVSYTNGIVTKQAKIPIATFNNINGLSITDNGDYVVTDNSGPAIIREAGEAGAGFFASGGLEGSTIDETDEMTSKIIPYEMYHKTLTAVMRRIIELQNNLVSNL